MIQTDCTATRTENGRNATPLAIIDSVHQVFSGDRLGCPGIDLDPASDAEINAEVNAIDYYDLADDGFSRYWQTGNVWLNPPGRTISKGKQVTAVQWIKKLYSHWNDGYIQNAIALCYRLNTISSLPKIMLMDAVICLTCSGVESPIVSCSGRLAFEEIQDGVRVPQGNNPSPSAFLCWSRDADVKKRFKAEFQQFGIVAGGI